MNQQLELAIAQLTGLHVAKVGGPNPAIELVVSMALTRKEWIAIQPDILWLDRGIWQEIDEHFKEPTKC